MIEQEQWKLWSARADVVRFNGALSITLNGVVTAAAYEALHMRLALERGCGERVLTIDRDVLLAVTSRSAVEAALRGTPACIQPAPVTMRVAAPRRQWAEAHCRLMRAHGLPRVAEVVASRLARLAA